MTQRLAAWGLLDQLIYFAPATEPDTLRAEVEAIRNDRLLFRGTRSDTARAQRPHRTAARRAEWPENAVQYLVRRQNGGTTSQ